MKTVIKYIIVAVIAGIIGWYASHQLTKSGKTVPVKTPIAKLKEQEIQTEAAEIKKEVDKNGLQHTIYKMVKEIDQSAVDAVRADLIDTIEALGIARDKLRQVTVYATTLEIKNQQLERKSTATEQLLFWKDHNFNISVTVPNDTLLKPTATLGYDADLVSAQYNKRRLLFWNDPYIDVYSNDNRFTIKGARTLTIKPKEPSTAGSLNARSDYNEYFGISGGPEIKLRFGRVNVNGNYQYYVNNSKWFWEAGVSYSLIGSN